MPRRTFVLLLIIALVFSACSPGEPTSVETTVAETTTTSTSTTLPPTTTTTAPFVVSDAPQALAAVVEDFYLYATGASSVEPVAPQQVIDTLTQQDGEFPETASAHVAKFGGQDVAVVESGPDVFLAVDDGSGWRIVGGEWVSIGVPAFYGDGPRHVAVVGSDARPGESVDNSRADSIHFVGLDGEGGGAVVGLPRDSYVAVPGHGTRKITSSLALGGPDVMMEAFVDLTDLPLEGYLLTGFAGFESLLSSVLGGVEVEVPFAINDRWAHVALSAGEQLLDGAQALGFARARKTVGGDLVRSGHQGVIMLAAAEMVQSMGYSAIPELMELSEEHLITSLTPEQLLTFSAMAISANLNEVPNVVAPGNPGLAGAASVVFLGESVDELWADLADGTLEG